MGSGDWNDGMDRVGHEGRGESVWLAWFVATCAEAFADLAKEVERSDLDAYWRTRAEELRQAADNADWDGEWYARAFDDDGLPWGSKSSDECQIDSISQSWAVLAGGIVESLMYWLPTFEVQGQTQVRQAGLGTQVLPAGRGN